MNNNISIRKVRIGDENILAHIQTEAWKEAFSTIISQEDMKKYADINKAKEMYSMILSKNIGNGFILSIDDIPHCIAYWDKARDDDFEDYAEIICIHSLSYNWGKGYGSMMMEYILNEIKQAGFKKVMLWVFEENNRARKFYENHRFILSDKSKKFCGAIEVMYCREL